MVTQNVGPELKCFSLRSYKAFLKIWLLLNYLSVNDVRKINKVMGFAYILRIYKCGNATFLYPCPPPPPPLPPSPSLFSLKTITE